MKIAKAKVWKTLDGGLVEDGHEKAAVLVAIKGQSISDVQLLGIQDVDIFFHTVNPKGEPAKSSDEAKSPVKVDDVKKLATKNKK